MQREGSTVRTPSRAISLWTDDFNSKTSAQKEAEIVRLKEAEGLDIELKKYIPPFFFYSVPILMYSRAWKKVMESGVGIAPPKRF